VTAATSSNLPNSLQPILPLPLINILDYGDYGGTTLLRVKTNARGTNRKFRHRRKWDSASNWERDKIPLALILRRRTRLPAALIANVAAPRNAETETAETQDLSF